ncbi:hypothetical protein V8B55DRAFT_1553456 [Mucor lusitanicus]|uniref:Apoptogenic protein 1, mitochondrial n=2 Tax=Mucor circinelloides f. lusitanicus TaxID=29924 RepID=A0A168P7M4_MUCCL|nr:hypothetical protein MUCCIDRAFT_107898 [Mucor lusitanicus CBS 277.49]
MALMLRHTLQSTCCQSYKRTLTTASKKKNWTESLTTPVAADMIGTPDPISNLRPVKYYISPNETTEEKEWRESCQRVDAFNEDFWQKNNTLFMNAKAEFEDQFRARGEEVTAEAMSVFYKDFLNKAYDRQMEYNRTWWKMNVAQLYPGFKAAMRSLSKPKHESAHAAQQSKGNGFWEKSFES